MKKLIMLLVCLFMFIGCMDKEVDISKKQVRNGVVYVVGDSKPFTGKLIGKYDNGQKKVSEEYKEGIQEGAVTRYYKNGNTIYTGVYVDGKKDGEWNYYSSENKLAAKLIYQNGKLIGEEQYLVDVDGLKNKVKNLFD